jgi:hypothetical protein
VNSEGDVSASPTESSTSAILALEIKLDEREENRSLEWHPLLLWFGKERPGHSWKGRVKAVLVGAHATAHSKELAAATSNTIVQH